MKIGSIFVKRPVMTSMVFLGITLFGFLCWARLPQELFPNISVPQLIVLTNYANAAPEEIENLITKPVEEAVGTVPNLKRITSISKEGLSAVKLEFSWGTDMGFAHLGVREKLDRMKDRLPPEAQESIIKEVNPFSKPILVISMTGTLDLADMTDLAKDVIKKKLEKTDGVGAVIISGGQEREILVEVDRGRLEASKISLPMVVDALKNSNYDYPAGVTQGRVVEYILRTNGRFENVSEIAQTIVHVERPEIDPVYKWKKKDTGGQTGEQRLIPLSSLVTRIETTLKDKTSYSRFNGKQNISISIQKQADANTVQVSKNVARSLQELKLSLPESLGLNIIYDESEYIIASLRNMRNNVLVGGALAFFILLIFLGQIRDSVNVGIAIPVSIFMTLIIMFFGGITVNILTLAGLALAVGTLSDAAIVVTENIERHRRQFQKSFFDAAIDGSNEVVGSMISASLTNVVVFFPLLFISGVAQKLFQDLFLVTMFTTAAGLFVSLTLIPRMSAYQWKIPFNEKKLLSRITLKEEQLKKINIKYANALVYAIKHPGLVVQLIGFVVLMAIVLLIWTPKTFMPQMDQGQFLVKLNMPIGTRLEITNGIAHRLENILLGIDGVNVMVNAGSAEDDEDIEALDSHEAQFVVTLDAASRFSTNQVLERFKTYAEKEDLEGGDLEYILQDSPLRSALAGGAPITVEIKGPEFDQLKIISEELKRKFEQDPSLYGIKTTFAIPSEETQVIVDKDRAASYEMSVADIAKTALIAVRGFVATKFKEGGKETDIRVRLQKKDRNDRDSIRHLALRSPRGTMVPLDNVAQIQSGHGTSEIRHLDQQRAVVVTAQVGKGTVDSAAKRVEKIISVYRNNKDYTVSLGGETQSMAESFSSLKYTLILAVLLIYMIMAAEFESIIQPLIIMVTVPFSFIGIVFTLFITNTPLSSVVVLGVLILAGLVVNNAIVMIDHMNGLIQKGMPLGEAVIKGSVDRFRPILVTSLTTILAVLPLAVGLGKGDDLAQPLAVVTFGGMFLSTLLTLFVVPLLYYQIAKRKV